MKTIKIKTPAALLLLGISIVILFACRKANSLKGGQTSANMVTGSVAGRVTDLNNVPISNAPVTAGTVATTTDANGQFTIKNAQLDKDAGFVKVTMAGYFNGSRTFLTSTNAANNVKIQLIPKIVSGSFTTGLGGNVNVSGGGTVNFLANSVVNATTNVAYAGSVSVSTFYLNPADPNFNEFMPGDLRGINTSNQQSILKVFGMASIEMDDASGEKLQLATGKTATISLPIPSAMQANAPATLPLWYFDETKGLWKQEGSATKQGINYVGTVAHFSFWASGQLEQSIKLDAMFKDSSGMPFSNNLVTITSLKYGATNGYTDSSGTVSGLVPSNDSLVMKVFNQNEEIYSQAVGPFVADTNLGIITIEITAVSDSQYIKVTLSGVDYLWAPADSITGARIDTSGSNFMVITGGMQESGFFSPQKSISLWFLSNDTAPGNYPVNTLSITLDYTVYASYGGNTTDTLNTNVTEYGLVGGYVSGTTSGQLIQQGTSANIPNIPFTISYRVKRIQ